MAVCNGLNSHALRPGSIYTGGTSDTLMELKVTQRHLGHCNMPLLCPGNKKHQALFVNEKRRNYELVLKQIESGELLWLQLLLGTVTRLLAGATVLHRAMCCALIVELLHQGSNPPDHHSSWNPHHTPSLDLFWSNWPQFFRVCPSIY